MLGHAFRDRPDVGQSRSHLVKAYVVVVGQRLGTDHSAHIVVVGDLREQLIQLVDHLDERVEAATAQRLLQQRPQLKLMLRLDTAGFRVEAQRGEGRVDASEGFARFGVPRAPAPRLPPRHVEDVVDLRDPLGHDVVERHYERRRLSGGLLHRRVVSHHSAAY